MSLSRVKIAKEQAELVKSLVNTGGNTGPFQTHADVLVLAAALGLRHQWRTPVETAAKEPAPISLEIFISRGYDWLFKLIAICETQDPEILSPYDAHAEAQRLQIFEEYANGGLIKLREELKGSVDYSETLSLILSQEKNKQDRESDEFDLSRFL